MQETVVYKEKTTKSIDHSIKGLGDSRENARIKGILMAATLAILLVSGCTGGGNNTVQLGRQAPAFSLEGLDGQILRLKDFQGKVVLLGFFATWCSPCQQEVPEFVRLYEKLKGHGLEIVAVGLDAQGAEVLERFARHYRIPYPVVAGTREVVLDYGGIESIPTTFIIDRNGRVADHVVGWRSASMLEQSIKELLEKKV